MSAGMTELDALAWEIFCRENTHPYLSWADVPARVQALYLLRAVGEKQRQGLKTDNKKNRQGVNDLRIGNPRHSAV